MSGNTCNLTASVTGPVLNPEHLPLPIIPLKSGPLPPQTPPTPPCANENSQEKNGGCPCTRAEFIHEHQNTHRGGRHLGENRTMKKDPRVVKQARCPKLIAKSSSPSSHTPPTLHGARAAKLMITAALSSSNSRRHTALPNSRPGTHC